MHIGDRVRCIKRFESRKPDGVGEIINIEREDSGIRYTVFWFEWFDGHNIGLKKSRFSNEFNHAIECKQCWCFFATNENKMYEYLKIVPHNTQDLGSFNIRGLLSFN